MSAGAEAIEALAGQDLDLPAFFGQVTDHLRRRVGFDVCNWLTYDPDVLLPIAGFDGGEPTPFELRLRYCANEQLEDDVHKFRDLARQPLPVGVLEPTANSRRRRELHEPRGLEHELRAALVHNRACWGSLTLARARGAPPFSGREVQQVAALSAALGHGLARAAVRRERSAAQAQPPGVLVLDGNTALVSRSETACAWLDVLHRTEGSSSDGLPTAVAALATRTRRDGVGRLRLRTDSGQWLALHGSRDASRPDERVYITIEAARRSEVLALLGRQYGLTPREQHVVSLVLGGLATRRIAERLGITQHTVQDHLKSIFDKTDVRSRRELAHRLALAVFGL